MVLHIIFFLLLDKLSSSHYEILKYRYLLIYLFTKRVISIFLVEKIRSQKKMGDILFSLL